MRLRLLLPLLLLACGGNREVHQYCVEAVILASVFSSSGDTVAETNQCVLRVNADLDQLSGTDRQQAEACISCIAQTETEECGCCQTNGQYDVMGTACRSACDTPGHKRFCDL